MRHFISDIHGCYHTLLSLIDKVRASDVSAQFCFVGDYPDRGLFSKQVVDLLIDLQSSGAVCLRGNHDDVIDFILNEHSESPPTEWMSKVCDARIYAWWTRFGLNQTMDSYGVKILGTVDDMNVFRNLVPESHKKFYRDLPLYWQDDSHFACHAFYRTYEEIPRDVKFIPNTKDRACETLWGRYDPKTFAYISTVWDKIGVFGHTPTIFYNSSVPLKSDKIRLIDTGASSGSYLSAYCGEKDDWIIQPTDVRDTCIADIGMKDIQ